MPDSTVPPFHGNINFNAQHSPMGAFTSFTCGHFGTRGGFGLQIGKPGDQDLYIGVKDGDRFSDAPLKVLPFYQGAGAENEAARYDVEREAGPAEQNVKPRVLSYAKQEIRRHYGWATDRWVTDDFEFTIYTPFGVVPSPTPNESDAKWSFPETELRYRLLPAVVATFTVDNSAGTMPKTALFAMGFHEKGLRLLDTGLESAIGFALRDELGVAGRLIESDDEAGTYLRDAFENDADILVRTRAEKVLVENGRAAGVEAQYADPESGKSARVVVRAPHVVVACNAPFTYSFIVPASLSLTPTR